MDDPTDRLLAELRARFGRPDLAYADPPARLSGGFFTDNYAFALRGAPDGWTGRLVLRMFPSTVATTQVRREAVVQQALAEQGFPAPRVLAVDEEGAGLGRAWFVMEMLSGRSLQAGIEWRQLAAGIRPMLRMPSMLAETIAQLHALDPEPVIRGLGDVPAGVERWLERLEVIARDVPELAPGARWLIDNLPDPRAPEVVCHGDLWLGNVLAERGVVTGVVDYSLATVAEPALEMGFIVMPYTIVPVALPPVIAPFARSIAGGRARNLLGPHRLHRSVARSQAGGIARRLVTRYEERTHVDLTNRGYFEAMRIVTELQNVVVWRAALARGEPPPIPRPTWDVASDRMTARFATLTGVELTLPRVT